MKPINNVQVGFPLIILILIYITGCTASREMKAFEYAKNKNSVEQYESFLKEHPSSSYREEVIQLINKRRLEIKKEQTNRLTRSNEWKTTRNINIFWELSEYLYDMEASKTEAEKLLGKPTKISGMKRSYYEYIVWDYTVEGVRNADNVRVGITLNPLTNKVNGTFTYLTENGYTTKHESYKY